MTQTTLAEAPWHKIKKPKVAKLPSQPKPPRVPRPPKPRSKINTKFEDWAKRNNIDIEEVMEKLNGK